MNRNLKKNKVSKNTSYAMISSDTPWNIPQVTALPCLPHAHETDRYMICLGTIEIRNNFPKIGTRKFQRFWSISDFFWRLLKNPTFFWFPKKVRRFSDRLWNVRDQSKDFRRYPRNSRRCSSKCISSTDYPFNLLYLAIRYLAWTQPVWYRRICNA